MSSATTNTADKAFFSMYEKGHAKRIEVRTGVTDGDYIEITSLNESADLMGAQVDRPWSPINGSEQVILGDLSVLTEGGPVEVNKASGKTKGEDTKPAITWLAPTESPVTTSL